MAALDLLSEVAADARLLVVVEDAQWLDRPTGDALAFVARRIESDPILLLVATRDGYSSALGDAGLPERTVAGLDDATAAALLDASAPGLAVATRSRVLREAAGNPLAILELPAALDRDDDERWAAGGVPLTDRLERAFADRVADLPAATRLLLLVAALSDEDRIDEILEAAAAVAVTTPNLDAAAPAIEAGLVHAGPRTNRLRHPPLPPAGARRARPAESPRAPRGP